GGMSPYMYSFNGQGFSASTNYSDLFAGTYELTVEDANGCQLTSIVEIPDGNNVNVDLGPDQTIQEGDPVSIYPQVSIDPLMISRLDWNVAFDLPCPDCLIQEDLYLNQATRFFLKITDENGCSAEDNVLILIEKKENIYVPNGFSPNGDGRNDRFYIFTDPNSVEEIEVLRIFNRWGEFVWENTNFQPNDPTQGWDGRVGGMDPNPAVFVWYAEIKMRSGEKRLLKGDVTLVE
ncbi:MAG: gliding motility-associated C-terminal domain-containing protein, partial [Bacteroidota bacterium]